MNRVHQAQLTNPWELMTDGTSRWHHRQTAKAPVDQVSAGALHFMLMRVLMDFRTSHFLDIIQQVSQLGFRINFFVK